MRFRNRSVRHTLRTIIMLTSTSALVLACFALVAVDLVGTGRRLGTDLEILADIIGSNSAASLMFGDRNSAETVLASLSARPAIVSACIYGVNEKIFIQYTARDSSYQAPLRSPKLGLRFTGKHIEVTRPVVFDGQIVGTIFIASDRSELMTRLTRYALAALVILVVSLLLALIVSQPLQKLLTDPILHLARVADRVRSEKDYSVRTAGEAGPEEFEALTSAFDEMLAGIQTRDRELEERRANLELQIAERTRELRVANTEMTRARDEAQQIADANEHLARHKQAVLNTAAEGIFGLNDKGVATFINRSAAEMFGTSIEELIGRPLHELIHEPEMAALPLEHCPVCSPTHHPVPRNGNTKFVNVAGNAFPIEYTTSSMREDNERGGAVVTFRDITDRLAVEKMKEEFISTVSHELRTPLTSIRGALGLLGSGLLGDVGFRAHRMLEIAVTNTDRLVRLINDILDLEKISSGKVELHRSPIAASALVCDAIDVVQNLVDRAGVSIVCEGADATLWVDRDRIVQTLTNLIGNAVKFSPPGTTVRVGGEVEGNEFTFFVSDEGRGIPQEKLEMIFERFKQVNASDSRDKGGSGLGLAICRSIVNAHGGRIWAESQEQRGSTFRFTVPLAESLKATNQASKYVLVCGEGSSGKLAEAIHATGYETVFVASLADVLVHPRASAVVLDLTADASNARAILQNASATRLPIVVAANHPPESFNANAALAAAWLRAPFTSADVAAALASASGARPVLIVEDDEDLARVIATSLEDQGLRAVFAPTGADAITACSSLEPALVILDLALPDVDGFGVVQWMREQPQLLEVPLLVYSARDVSAADQPKLRLGTTEFLTKSRAPLTMLVDRVLALLKSRANAA